MAINDQKWSKIAKKRLQMDHKWPKPVHKIIKNAKNGQKRSKMGPTTPQKRPKMGQKLFRWSKGHKWAKMVKIVPVIPFFAPF